MAKSDSHSLSPLDFWIVILLVSTPRINAWRDSDLLSSRNFKLVLSLFLSFRMNIVIELFVGMSFYRLWITGSTWVCKGKNMGMTTTSYLLKRVLKKSFLDLHLKLSEEDLKQWPDR